MSTEFTHMIPKKQEVIKSIYLQAVQAKVPELQTIIKKAFTKMGKEPVL